MEDSLVLWRVVCHGDRVPDELPTQPPMPDAKWSAGSLRITSRTISAEEISEALGLDPHDKFEQGSLAIPCNPDSFRRESSVWILTSGLGSDRWPDEHAAALIKLLEGRHEALARLAADCEVELLLGFGSENGQGGCVLPSDLLKEVGLLGIDVVLDLYPPTPGDVSSTAE
ncbi:DUF4279 domain-containing protein [Streptomyces sp. NPDC020681]|uniref:DUF4279 domain-containing protein n=1 Tax=Streptomyces sp. NPDC020681 TaxID=3365083 RepID=UPI0037A64493